MYRAKNALQIRKCAPQGVHADANARISSSKSPGILMNKKTSMIPKDQDAKAWYHPTSSNDALTDENPFSRNEGLRRALPGEKSPFAHAAPGLLHKEPAAAISPSAALFGPFSMLLFPIRAFSYGLVYHLFLEMSRVSGRLDRFFRKIYRLGGRSSSFSTGVMPNFPRNERARASISPWRIASGW